VLLALFVATASTAATTAISATSFALFFADKVGNNNTNHYCRASDN